MKAGNLRISGFLFSQERVVAGSGILQRRLPAEAFAQQTEHKLARTARRASDSKSAEHKKSFSGAAWIFCMEPNSFGVTRGEQPLVRASRASKVAGAFLVLFWHAKENIPGGERVHKSHTAYPLLEYALHGKQHAKRRAAHWAARLLCSSG